MNNDLYQTAVSYASNTSDRAPRLTILSKMSPRNFTATWKPVDQPSAWVGDDHTVIDREAVTRQTSDVPRLHFDGLT